MARGPQHAHATMENATPFDLKDAIRRWRAEFGTPSSLSAVEMEELESHLRDHVAALETAGMTPEAAFRAAVKQLGERQGLATEFAKINPQRIWLERAIWMAVGVFLFSAFHRLADAPADIIFRHSFGMRWDPTLCIALSRFGGLGVVAVMTALLWFLFWRRPGWGRALVGSCERSLLATGVAMVLALWGCNQLRYFYDDTLHRYLPRLHAWLLPTIQPPYPDEAVIYRVTMFCAIATSVIWAAGLCVLAARVVRRRRSFSLASGAQKNAADFPWLERFTWMVAGWVLLQFGVRELHSSVLLPVLWILPALGSSAILEHLVGLITAVLHLALWATPFWACWIFTTRRPELAGWISRAFQYRPFWTTVGATLLLNVNLVLWLLLLCTGIQVKTPGNGLGPIISEWNFGPWMAICQRVAPALLLVALLRWRMKLREQAAGKFMAE